jgi:hypothetical protein
MSEYNRELGGAGLAGQLIQHSETRDAGLRHIRFFFRALFCHVVFFSVADPGCSRILILAIPDPKKKTKEWGEKKICCPTLNKQLNFVSRSLELFAILLLQD